MPLTLYQVTLGAAATQLSATNQPICQILIGAPAHDAYIGTKGVTTTTGVKIPTAVTSPTIFGTAEARSAFDATEVYFIGTQNDTINVLAITL